LPLLIFITLVALAISYRMAAHPVSAQSAPRSLAVPTLAPGGGTIPPGGTVPPPANDPLHGQVRVIHLAPFSPSVANTAVDVCNASNAPIAGFTNLRYLWQSGYVTFDPGNYDWTVGTPGCGSTLIDIPPFSLARGSVLTIYIVGDGTNQPLTVVISVDQFGFPFSQNFPFVARFH